MALCTSWIIVYAAMLWMAVAHGELGTWRAWLLGTPMFSERFGDLTLRDLASGQVWRVLTATFVHFGFVHLAMNLFMLYHLGSLIEDWYGPWQTVSLYVLVGAGGNALSALIRHVLGSAPNVHSGGGSTVVLGFVSFLAIVGWRERTRTGDFLRSQMVAILVYTALLGLALPLVNYFVTTPLIDNWAHAGGAIVGALAGSTEPLLVRNARNRLARWAGQGSALILVAAALAQWGHDRADAPRRAEVRLTQREHDLGALAWVEQYYRQDCALMMRSRTPVRGTFMPRIERGAIDAALSHLATTKRALGGGATRHEYECVHALLEQARGEPPGTEQWRAFVPPFRALVARARAARDAALKERATLRNPSRTTAQAPRN
jgi:membrane associated rhomboid family serine protease